MLSTEANRLRLLNDVGAFVWERCDGRTLGEIVRAVGDTFDVGPDRAQADVLQFARDLTERGLLVLSGEDDYAPNSPPDPLRGPTDL